MCGLGKGDVPVFLSIEGQVRGDKEAVRPGYFFGGENGGPS